MFVDKRITLRDFKSVIGKRIDLAPEDFRVCIFDKKKLKIKNTHEEI